VAGGIVAVRRKTRRYAGGSDRQEKVEGAAYAVIKMRQRYAGVNMKRGGAAAAQGPRQRCWYAASAKQRAAAVR